MTQQHHRNGCVWTWCILPKWSNMDRKLATSHWLWVILNFQTFKPIYLAKRKQTMCDQQSANQPTLSCDISWLSIQLHNNAATTTIIEMYGHFEPCWKAVGCFRTKIWIRKGHQLCRVRNFMLGCPAGAQTYAHTHWTLTYIICLYIYIYIHEIVISLYVLHHC